MGFIKTEYESALRLKNLVCLESSTKRETEQDISGGFELKISKNIEPSVGEVVVDVEVVVFSQDQPDAQSFEARVVMRGVFEVPQLDDPHMLDNITKRNTVAIIFPYIRSQMTLITSQPGMAPLVIPAINVNSLFAEEEVATEVK